MWVSNPCSLRLQPRLIDKTHKKNIVLNNNNKMLTALIDIKSNT